MSSTERNQEVPRYQLNGKELSGNSLKRYDSLDLESSKVPGTKKVLTYPNYLNFFHVWT